MAGSVKHAFVSEKGDGGDATVVRPSDWNDEHDLSGLVETIPDPGVSWASTTEFSVDDRIKVVDPLYGNLVWEVVYADGTDFPTVAATNSSSDTSGTSHTVSLPASIAAGDLLVIFFQNNNSVTPTTPAGWTSLGTDSISQFRQTIFYKIASGAEGGSVSVSTGATDTATAHIAYRITGHDPAMAPEGTAATGTSSTADPPRLDPAGWGTEHTLWIEVVGWDNQDTPTYSTNYTDSTTEVSGNYCSIGVARRNLSAASENPGTASFSGSVNWIAATVAIRPASALPAASGQTGSVEPAWTVFGSIRDGDVLWSLVGVVGGALMKPASDVLDSILSGTHATQVVSFFGTTPEAPIVLDPVKWVLHEINAYSPGGLTYDNGPLDDGVGATITETDPTDGALTVYGETPTVGDRLVYVAILFSAHDAFSGIYTVTALGDGATTPFVLTRATDCDSFDKLFRFWAVQAINPVVTGFEEASVRVTDFDEADGLFIWLAVATRGGMSSGVGLAGLVNTNVKRAFAANDGVASADDAFAANLAWAQTQYSAAFNAGSADGYFSFATGFASAYGPGERAHSSGASDSSWVQHAMSDHTAGAETTDDTETDLVNFNNDFPTMDVFGGFDKTVNVRGRIVARRTDVAGTDSAWDFQGVLRGDGSSAYSWIGGTAPVPAVIAQDAGAAAWVVEVAIDGTDLRITVTGEADTTMNWMASLNFDWLRG